MSGLNSDLQQFQRRKREQKQYKKHSKKLFDMNFHNERPFIKKASSTSNEKYVQAKAHYGKTSNIQIIKRL